MWLDFKGALAAVIYSFEVRTLSYRPKYFSAQNALTTYAAVTWVVGRGALRDNRADPKSSCVGY